MLDRRQFLATTLCALPTIAHAVHPDQAHAGNIAHGEAISLVGIWQFALDAKSRGMAGEWFKLSLPDSIELPGSCEQHGFGSKPEVREVRRLTRVLKYVGPAWYQREIFIPQRWFGKRVELFLERCHWETTVWVGDQKVGMRNSLSVPHVYDLGRLSPGRHKLTICVDNTYKIQIGTWAHAITEDTQTNWNGIIGRIEMRATDPIWIREVQVFPSKLKVSVGNNVDNSVEARIQSQKVVVPTGGADFELPFSCPEMSWDEFSPRLSALAISLKAGRYHDTKVVSYGIRHFSTKNRQFTLNERPVMLRGAVDECIYPLTGYPPMDKQTWLRVLGICHSYGFNFMRFHSWCPPEAAFAAADELGFLLQIELPLWTMDTPPFGKLPERDEYIRQELNRILDTYGNHPSFGFMAMGNESGGSLETLVRSGRARDPRHLFRCENGDDLEHGDYIEAGMRGIVGPQTDWDRWSVRDLGWIASNEGNKMRPSRTTLPTFVHELGQWEMYPDLDEVKKYTGTLRAHYFEDYHRSLVTHRMLDQAKDFAEASGKFSLLLYKEEIEASLRTFPLGGFQILEARDYPGQGVAIVGWLDAFWESKGLITPQEFREFCAPTVCLLRMPTRTITTADTFVARAEISHFGPTNLETTPEWSIRCENGEVIAQGRWPACTLQTGQVTPVGKISATLQSVTAPARLVVNVRAAGKENRWNIWVYPNKQPLVPTDVVIAHHFDQTTRDALVSGKRVLMFSSPTEGVIYPRHASLVPNSVRALPVAQPGRSAIPGSFMPTFYSLQLFNQIGTLGILCDPRHPALADFPTEKHADWQWADLLGNFSAGNSFQVAGAPESTAENLRKAAADVMNRSKAIILNDTPAEFRPIVQVIDNHERNAKLGVIFEARVGAGKLLVCAMDLDTDLAKRPAAQQLRRSLVNYASSDRFAPGCELPVELLRNLL